MEYQQEFRNFGVLIQGTLSWDMQAEYICRKMYKGLYQLRRMAIDFPQHVRQQLVKSLLIPNLDYAVLAHCDMNSEQIEPIQKSQNTSVRFSLKKDLWNRYPPP